MELLGSARLLGESSRIRNLAVLLAVVDRQKDSMRRRMILLLAKQSRNSFRTAYAFGMLSPMRFAGIDREELSIS